MAAQVVEMIHGGRREREESSAEIVVSEKGHSATRERDNKGRRRRKKERAGNCEQVRPFSGGTDTFSELFDDSSENNYTRALGWRTSTSSKV